MKNGFKKIADVTSNGYYGSIGFCAHKVDRGFMKLGVVAASLIGAPMLAAAGAYDNANGYVKGGGGGTSLNNAVTNSITNIKEPAFIGLGAVGVTVGAFQVYSGISSFTKRSSGQGQQQGSIADDLKKIGGGGALAAIGGFAGMSSETIKTMFA